jgi:hypothetical protein
MGVWVRGKYQDSPLEGRHVEGYYITLTMRETENIRLARLRTPPERWAYDFRDPERLTEGTYPLQKGQWYRVTVEVRGSNIKVFVGNTRVINHNDSTFSEGTVGFVCYKMEYATWDDVVVTPLD